MKPRSVPRPNYALVVEPAFVFAEVLNAMIATRSFALLKCQVRKQAYQDVCFPLEELPSALALSHRLFEIYPLMLYPCKLREHGGMVHPQVRSGSAAEEAVALNLGICAWTPSTMARVLLSPSLDDRFACMQMECPKQFARTRIRCSRWHTECASWKRGCDRSAAGSTRTVTVSKRSRSLRRWCSLTPLLTMHRTLR